MTRAEKAERNVHIIAMYEAGMTQADVGYEFFLSDAQVGWLLRRNGGNIRTASASAVRGWATKRKANR